MSETLIVWRADAYLTLAYVCGCSLAKRGARVGILDADIYGPSLPTMVSPTDLTIRQSRKMKNFVEPLEYEGVKCMSFGFVNQKAAPGAGGSSRVTDAKVFSSQW